MNDLPAVSDPSASSAKPRKWYHKFWFVLVMLLAISLLSPLPFSQVIPNLIIILIAFSFLEADGVLLSVSVVLAAVSMAITAGAIWATAIAAFSL